MGKKSKKKNNPHRMYFLEELRAKIDRDYMYANQVYYTTYCVPELQKEHELRRVRSPGWLSWYLRQDRGWRDPHEEKKI